MQITTTNAHDNRNGKTVKSSRKPKNIPGRGFWSTIFPLLIIGFAEQEATIKEATIHLNCDPKTLFRALEKKLFCILILFYWFYSLLPGVVKSLDFQKNLILQYPGNQTAQKKELDTANNSIELYNVCNAYVNNIKK